MLSSPLQAPLTVNWRKHTFVMYETMVRLVVRCMYDAYCHLALDGDVRFDSTMVYAESNRASVTNCFVNVIIILSPYQANLAKNCWLKPLKLDSGFAPFLNSVSWRLVPGLLKLLWSIFTLLCHFIDTDYSLSQKHSWQWSSELLLVATSAHSRLCSSDVELRMFVTAPAVEAVCEALTLAATSRRSLLYSVVKELLIFLSSLFSLLCFLFE